MNSPSAYVGIAVFLLFGLKLQAQIENVDPTIRIVGGEAFYIHTALRGQTIQQIAEAYFSDVPAIRANNPGLNDPLAEGLKIRIPYSDESLEAMSEASSSTKKPKEPVRVEKTADQPSVVKKKPDPTPIEEAVSLLEDKPAEEPKQAPELTQQEEAIQAMDDLNALSASIRESLANLNRIQEELDGTAAPTVLDTLRPEHARSMMDFLGSRHTNYFDTTQADRYYLKEFFMMDINPEGIVFDVRDERTITNSNTHQLDLDELKYLKIEAIDGEPDMAIGIVEACERLKYVVKVKKGKIKYVSKPASVSNFSASHPHAQLIKEQIDASGSSGSGSIYIIEGKREINVYEQFEYNPFGTLKSQVGVQEIRYIDRMEF